MRTRIEQVEKVLVMMGGTHSLDDILAMIDAGTMQSFSDDDTWVITEVVDCPRKRILEVFLVVGTMDGALKLEPEVFSFGKKIGADLVRAFGRDGWAGEMKRQAGWRGGMRIFMKEVGG